MTTELRPLGVTCNIQCQYCYQNNERDAGPTAPSFDLELMMRTVETIGGPFTLFGGEPLLLSVDILETLLAWGYNKFGRSGLQTNGTLITDRHIRLFRKYNVGIGISIDGPVELNDLRWAGTISRTRHMTRVVEKNIRLLCREGLRPGIIITLHRGNATAEKLPVMNRWISDLHSYGIRSIRLHSLESDTKFVEDNFSLSIEENVRAFLNFWELQKELPELRFDIFDDMQSMLLGNDERVTCVWKGCDPFTTRAVQGVDGDGQRSNCGRTNKDGINFIKASVEGYERYIALYHTEERHGGCKGCRFFLMCKGQCPGTAIGGDWRNRSQHCAVWKRLYAHFEKILLAKGYTPLSLAPFRLNLEKGMLSRWSEGTNPSIASELKALNESKKGSGHQPVGREKLESRGAPGPNLEFLRTSWTSERARGTWEPRIKAIRAMWRDLEWRSVSRGIRACALMNIAPDTLPQEAAKLADSGLHILPFARQRLGENGGYSNVAKAPNAGENFVFRVIVALPDNINKCKRAMDTRDHRRLAELLGYPECCYEFFRSTWIEQGVTDTTWPMARNSAGAKKRKSVVRVHSGCEANILLRWLGLRLVPHFPCGFECPETLRLGRVFKDLGRNLGYRNEMRWLEDALCWPLEWTALHGLAELRAPIFRLAMPTDFSNENRVVRFNGSSYPEEGACGLRFPYTLRGVRSLTNTVAFRNGKFLLAKNLRSGSDEGKGDEACQRR